jgi:MFS transporter, AAHS family, 4-hydroxybenzoate transporter
VRCDDARPEQSEVARVSEVRRTTDLGRLLDEARLSPRKLGVLVLCGLVLLLDGYDIQTMALAVPSLASEWNLDASAFSYALSASVLGMLVSTALVAPIGDRLGRRPVLIVGMLVVGVASIATAFCETPTQLVLWRFATGIGLGMSMPNATALTSEFVPLRSRAFLITAMFISIALGAFIAGFSAPALIEVFGWRSIFLVGGILPLLLSGLLLLWIPESLRLLVAQRPNDRRIARVSRRFLPGVDPATLYVRPEELVDRQGVAVLFSARYRSRTVLLWCVFGLNLFVLFVLISWLPTILTDAGWTRPQALRGSVMIQAGGIAGGLVIAHFVDRGHTVAAMTGGYALVAASLALFLVVPAAVGYWTVLLLAVGAGVSGAQGALTALSAIFYAPGVRATGTGWASACGRAGAVLAPIVGGIVIERFAFEPHHHLALLIPPVLLCGACVLLLPSPARTGDAHAVA